MATQDAKSQGIQLEMQDDLPADQEFLGDEEQLEQVMINLINNAIKFTPEAGQVRISSRENNGQWLFEVVDTVEKVTGIRIGKEIAERRPGDPAVLLASSEKVANDLGWKPLSKLRTIISSAWEWIKKHPDGYLK